MRTPTRGWGLPSQFYRPRNAISWAISGNATRRASREPALRSPPPAEILVRRRPQEILANTPRLEQPPVDPRIPLAGFTFNPASQLFEDSSTGYVSTRRRTLTNLRTRHEYTYDTESRLFRPRAAALQADAVSLKGIVSASSCPTFRRG